jgi:hypothetical protein
MQRPKSNVPIAGEGEIARLVATAGEQGEADSYAGKRQFTRFTEGMRLDVTLNPTEPTGSWGVYMHNVSDGGFAFWSKKEVLARTTLFVREYTDDNSQGWLPAKVTHCTVGIRGFLVGAAFEQPPART